MGKNFFSQLNLQQKKAVFYSNGPSIILAGAGSGKTRVLIHKVAYLINQCQLSPSSILMITFTNKAAIEMKERINKLSLINSNLGFIGTFHSFCASVLRRFGYLLDYDRNFLIYDEEDQLSMIKEILKESKDTKLSPYYLLEVISYAKNHLVTPEKYLEFDSSYRRDQIARIYKSYQRKLKENNAMDFDDLLVNVALLWNRQKEPLKYYQEKLKYILVDEFQDTNFVQFELIKLLGKKYQNITVVGDFSQSIYSWRGACLENLQKFKQEFPSAKIFYLEQNYRSTQKILDFAYRIISQNTTHPILNLVAKKKGGEDICFYEANDQEDEAVFVAEEIIKLSKMGFLPSQIAVLYRINAQSRAIEEVFLHYGLPYILIGGMRFYERKEIKDILAFLRLVINPQDEISFKRVKNLGKKRFLKFQNNLKELRAKAKQLTTNEIIEEIFQITDYLSLYQIDNEEDFARIENIKELKSVALNFPDLVDFLQQVALVEQEYYEGEKKNIGKEGVRLMTLHAAKGLEFEAVFITGVEEGIIPHSKSLEDINKIEEERRLFYVGITRAKKKLYILYTKNRFLFGRRILSLKSRFLAID